MSLNSVQRLQRRSRKYLSQSKARAAILFFRSARKTLYSGHWDLASCQKSLNSVQWLQRRSRKCLSQSEARADYLVFLIGPNNTNRVNDEKILLAVKNRWILFRRLQRRSRKCLSQSEAKEAILFFWSARKTLSGLLVVLGQFCRRYALSLNLEHWKIHSFPHFSPTCFDIWAESWYILTFFL